jgi:threonine aldolase
MNKHKPILSFASDNNSGASPEIMAALAEANRGHAVGYGDDPWTASACARFKEEFGPSAETFFVWNGTGANVLALSLLCGPGSAALCSECAHIFIDEAGAPEAAGIKSLPLPSSPEGKLLPEGLKKGLEDQGNVHKARPACVSISEPTELGAVYSLAEIRELAAIAHGAGLPFHMDGARLANAAVVLGLPFRAFTVDAGVDILSFGGTKNGLLCGEAVVTFRPELAAAAPYLRKARLQLASKMRFISAQYEAYLEGELWRRNAENSNREARRLAARLEDIPGVELLSEPETNAVFARIPRAAAERLRKDFFFYDWENGLVRWMTSFDTSDEDVDLFAAALRAAMGSAHGAAMGTD